MDHPAIIGELIPQLTYQGETERFIVYAEVRNPAKGAGLGSHGVIGPCWVECLLKALARLEKTLDFPHYTGKIAAEKIAVYVLDVAQIFRCDCPITVPIDSFGRSYICLPSGNSIPTLQHALHRAEADAVHEGVHAINHTHRSLLGLYSGPWGWFDEATAVFFETAILDSNPDTLMFGKDWVNYPERSLDSPEGQYQAGIFIRYLAHRAGVRLITDVWTRAETTEKPMETMARLLGERGEVFASADPEVADLFASGYCMDAYGPRFARLGGFERALQRRFGGRAVAHSFVPAAGEPLSCEGVLDHLACQYYRISLPKRFTSLRVTLQPASKRGVTPLKAEMAAVWRSTHRDTRWAFQRPAGVGPDNAQDRVVALKRTEIPRCDHLVVVVSNCGTRACRGRHCAEHDDGVGYSLEVDCR